ncbi:hypothetical protein K7711_20245 [Nocardia sp. CA2R105]|uniref:hypothetical protein n=1 Tax=Nocardia coffeae TaxID=2873381 RepID=UPI001CA60F11|nr:hypothetical protein [Nocardia coffeae]MBY8858815.1 hypothetical protein [Nocardia coffeae]
MLHKRLQTVLMGGALVMAAVAGGTATAGAAPLTYTDSPLAQSSTAVRGIGCAGAVWGNARTWHNWPQRRGEVTFTVLGSLKFLGIQAPWCAVTPTVHWRNLTTGASGSQSVNLTAPAEIPDFFGMPTPKRGEFVTNTGSGRVEVRIDTDMPHSQSVTTIMVD